MTFDGFHPILGSVEIKMKIKDQWLSQRTSASGAVIHTTHVELRANSPQNVKAAWGRLSHVNIDYLTIRMWTKRSFAAFAKVLRCTP